MGKLEKALIIIILAMLVALGFLFLKKRNTPSPPPPPVEDPMTWTIKSVKDFKPDPKKVPKKEQEALKESLHEGMAFFADLYRLELAVLPKGNSCLYLLFIDNYLAQPVYPGNTDLKLRIENNNLNLVAQKPATLLNYSKCVKIGDEVEINGKLRGQFLKHKVKIKNFRSTKY